MNREPIEREWIKHCEEQLARCPNERAMWEKAIEESLARIEAYKIEQAVQKPNS